MAQTVIGIFDNAAEAQQAVEKLTDKGISRDRIDVKNNTSGVSASSSSSSHPKEESGIGHFFRSLFSDDDDSDKYSHVARRSESIVTVHAQTSDEAEDAADILDDCGAVNVDEHAAALGYSGKEKATDNYRNTDSDYRNTVSDYRNTDTDYKNTDSNYRNTESTDETTKIPVIEENIEVGKRQVVTGGARVRSRIVERPVEESLRLREENVRVERTPVDRAATNADLENFSERQIEMTETSEVPVVNKEARVVEEVSLNKEVNERTEKVSDTVRKTEVDVEDIESKRDTDGTEYNSSKKNTHDF